MPRLLAILLAALVLLLASAAPASAATKNAGIPDLTPYGGYLGNYLAPDGTRVYCIDSPLPWPSGTTSGPSSVDVLTTTWGSTLTTVELTKLNYVLTVYGQTDDAVQAAAVAAFVNAYTSGWARDLGAGYAAGAWYLDGNTQVTAVYDAIWADAEANALATGTATVQLDAEQVTVAGPPGAMGTLTLTGAVRTDTGEASFAIASGETVPITGTPGDDELEYEIAAHVALAAPVTGANLVLYSTPEQQRTIRGGVPGSAALEAAASVVATAPPRLAATGTAGSDAALVALGLVATGILLAVAGNTRRHRALTPG